MKPEAQLVHDGYSFQIPAACGTPASGQMEGTVAERLAELAGRECYDSLGHGRDSVAFHRHVLAVGHLSVYEHFHETVALRGVAYFPEVLLTLMNRPGLWFRCRGQDLLVTFNLRCILDWAKWVPPNRTEPTDCPLPLLLVANQIAPNVIGPSGPPGTPHGGAQSHVLVEFAPPETDEERWVTLRVTGSRGFSHELVRHGDRTAMSQRSTRYVDEDDSPWCLHPLVRRLRECGLPDQSERVQAAPSRDAFFATLRWSANLSRFIAASQALYAETVSLGSAMLANLGADSGTARKQARGAARGFLGNALGTSLIFSATVAQWRRMLALRSHPAADAEMRESAVQVLRALRESAYCHRFADMTLVPSQDGLGEVLADGFKA